MSSSGCHQDTVIVMCSLGWLPLALCESANNQAAVSQACPVSQVHNMSLLIHDLPELCGSSAD